MIEQWGRGTQLIVGLCLAAGHPEPEYIEKGGVLMVRMYSKNPMETRRKVSNNELLAHLEPRQMKILKLLSSNPRGLSMSELMQELSDEATQRTILRDLKSLEMQGLVSLSGKGKKSIWSCLIMFDN